ncbi:Vms1/Ankzf1 family peptidyl-tRNA hydrolase [Microbacterium sp. KRD172]|uniref:baeRF2 domain-containing protein n=1 Tax=Microbacterium sp. KRD172 TaxID=2729727 RepID=UPI0019D06D58|nr:Vms1/Ankzf1 family peptidyl-tRNA hydrolase [Microbacterium sp. KRD172]
MSDRGLADLLSRPGPWASAYVDGPGVLPQVEEEALRRSVRERLEQAGAPEEDAAAIEAALATRNGLPSPSTRVVLASGGRVELDQGFVGARVGPERLDHAPVPTLLPLLRHLGAAIRYLVVETSRDGADIHLETAGRGHSDADAEIEGQTDDITKVQAGGWSHAAYQRYAENTWKSNQEEVAAEVSELIRRHHPQFVALSGDVRARQLLTDALTDTERALIVDVDAHTRADGADSAELDSAIARSLEERERSTVDEVRDRAAADSGSGGATGLEEVIAALQQARVETLLLDGRMLDDERTLLALDAPPWVAGDESESLGADVVARVHAAEALARAAILTDARVLVEDDEPTAEDAPRESRAVRDPVAVLRWADDAEASDAS